MRSTFMLMAAGLLIAVLAAAQFGPGSSPVKLGGIVFVVGFIAWQIKARQSTPR